MYVKVFWILAVLCAVVIVARLMNKGKSGAASQPESGQSASARRVDVTSGKLREMIANNEDFVILDVRNPNELVSGPAPLKGAVNIPLPELSKRYSELPAGKDIVAVCMSGFRSAKAADFLIQKGFEKVYNLKGGMAAYGASEK